MQAREILLLGVLAAAAGVGAQPTPVPFTGRLPSPSMLFDPVRITEVVGEGTCPATLPTEEYRLPSDGLGVANRICNATSNLPPEANTGTGQDRFWKSGNNVENSSLTVTLIQVQQATDCSCRVIADGQPGNVMCGTVCIIIVVAAPIIRVGA